MYTAIVARLVRHTAIVMVAFVGLIALAAWWYNRVPTGFFPTEDQGYILASIQLPDAASQQRTREVSERIDAILEKTPGVADWFTIGGLSLLDQSNAPNTGTMFITFEDWDKRLDQGLTLDAILNNLRGEFGQIQDAVVFPFAPPAIRGLGVRGGFEMIVEDRAGLGRETLFQTTTAMVEDARSQTGLSALNSTFRPGVPQLYIDINRTKVKTLNIPLTSVFNTLQAYLGSAYVNDFNKFGRIYQVRIQAEPEFRAQPEDIQRLEVRNLAGQMIPLGTFVTVKKSFGPQTINRYNLYPNATISGEPAQGYSTGEALQLMEQIASTNLSTQMGYDWTGMAYQEKKIGGEAVYLMGMAVLLVYLVLAAQYESWFTPWAVILVVPLGLLGAVAAVDFRGMDNNLYTQIGIVLIIALASKNAILIVEFARDIRARGTSILDSAIEAARLRFRPILMTSFAFILGVVPLVVANGAGAAGQRALGTAVFGGMIASTVLAVFFVPVFFVIFQRLGEWWGTKKAEDDEPQEPKVDEKPKMELVTA